MSKTLKDLMKKDFDEVRKEARDETIVASARNVMDKFDISATEALEAVGAPQSDFAKYLAIL